MIEFVFRPIDRWPQEPTRNRSQARFRVSYSKTLALLSYELERIGARRAYLQADVREHEIRLDGQLRADARPSSPRVIVAADTKHGPILLPCDTYADWRDNLRAIALSLESLRAVDRHGVTKRGEQYRGLKQITAGDGPINSDEAAVLLARLSDGDARQILGSAAAADDAYRAAAKRHHPDVSSDEAATKEWNRLQVAVAILRNHHQRA